MRLAKTYQKICSAGCMLFHDWKAVIFCNKEKNPNVYVEFGASGQSLKARGGDPTSQIRGLCDCMDELLESWLEHVDQQRSEFYYLNYFTAKQLMILQKELAILNEEDQDRIVDRLVFPILSLISENFDQDDLSQSFSRASNKLLNIDSDCDSEDAEDDENDEDGGLISLLSGVDEEEQIEGRFY